MLAALWGWLERQGVPGFVLGSWGAAVPIGAWIHKVTGKRHRERIAAMKATAPVQEKP